MPNPYNNEVIFNGQTLMSLKEDTVTPDKVIAGETFHDRSGAPQTGSLITHNVLDRLDSTSASDALSANQGRELNARNTALSNKLSVSSSTINVNSYTGNVDASVNRVFKFNGIVHLSLVVNTTNSFKFPSSTTLFTIPDGYRPQNDIHVPAICQVNETRIQYFVVINANGQIWQNLSSNVTGILVDTVFVQ